MRTIIANGMKFGCLEAGEGPLVICLHGFPDTPHSFKPLLASLASAGYHALAPFMRGYAPTGFASDECYQTAALGEDVLALIGAAGASQATLIGHDWGALAAYAAAVMSPATISRLVTMAVPYGPGLLARLIADPVQQRRSWYMYLLASPLGAAALAQDDFALVERLWADWSPAFRLGETAMHQIKTCFRTPGVAQAAAAYYKHVFHPELHDPARRAMQSRVNTATIDMPALYLHGVLDGCIGCDIETDRSLYTAGMQAGLVQGAGHFLHVEKPDLVNPLILDFLG